MRTEVTVFLPNGTGDEVAAVRAAPRPDGVLVRPVNGRRHARGQRVPAGVVFSEEDAARIGPDVRHLEVATSVEELPAVLARFGQATVQPRPTPEQEPPGDAVEQSAPDPEPERPAQGKLSAVHDVGRWFNVVDEDGTIVHERVTRTQARAIVAGG